MFRLTLYLLIVIQILATESQSQFCWMDASVISGALCCAPNECDCPSVRIEKDSELLPIQAKTPAQISAVLLKSNFIIQTIDSKKLSETFDKVEYPKWHSSGRFKRILQQNFRF